MPGISFRISLDGSEQVNKQLQTVAQTAEQSFASTTAAVSKLGRTADQAFATAAVAAKTFGASVADLEKVQSTIQAVADQARANGTSFSQLAKNYDRASGSIGGAAAAFAATAAGARAAGKAAEESARGFSLSRREIGAVRTALREMNLGVVGGQFAALGRVASVFGPWAIGITAVGAAAAGATAGLFKFAEAAVKTATTVGELAAISGSSFESMSSLQIAFAMGGTSLEKFAQELANVVDGTGALKGKLAESADAATGAALNLEQAELALLKLRGRANPARERRLAIDKAELAVSEAARKADEAEANNLEDLVQKYNNLARGIKQTFDPLTTLESKANAVKLALAGIKDPDKKMQKLADIFKTLGEEDRAKLGKALGLSPEFIATLTRGGEAMRQMQAEVQRLGLVLNALNQQDLSNLKNAQSEVGGLFDALKNKMGALASPAFTSFFQGLAQGIKDLVPQFLELARTFGQLDFSAVGRAVAEFALKLANAAVEVGKFFIALASGDTAGMEEALNKLGALATEAGNKIGKALAAAVWSGFKDALVESLTGEDPFGMAELSQKLIKAIKEFRFTSIDPKTTWSDLFKKLFGGALISPAGAAEAGGGQLGGADFGPMIAGAEVAAVRIKQIFADAFSPPATIDFSGIITAAQTAAGEISAAFANIDIASVLTAQIDGLIAKFNELAIAAATAAQSMQGGAPAEAGAGANGGGLARGGLIGGRGSGTSDSNLAWVSRGEHIMPARAVRQPGVLSLLEALRRSGGNLRGILDDMGRFARGGLVLPAFAAGGQVGGMSNVTIQFPGLPAIGGLRASSDVVDQLHRAAALAQVRSGGRKPSRYS